MQSLLDKSFSKHINLDESYFRIFAFFLPPNTVKSTLQYKLFRVNFQSFTLPAPLVSLREHLCFHTYETATLITFGHK